MTERRIREGGRPRIGVFSGDYQPPMPDRSFTVRVHGVDNDYLPYTDEGTVGRLSEERLYWIIRTAEAELRRREEEAS